MRIVAIQAKLPSPASSLTEDDPVAAFLKLIISHHPNTDEMIKFVQDKGFDRCKIPLLVDLIEVVEK